MGEGKGGERKEGRRGGMSHGVGLLYAYSLKELIYHSGTASATGTSQCLFTVTKSQRPAFSALTSPSAASLT